MKNFSTVTRTALLALVMLQAACSKSSLISSAPQLQASGSSTDSGSTRLADFVNKLSAQQPNSLNDAVALLPSDLLAHFTFMYASRSSQAASFELPRAILYGDDGTTLVTFNGAQNGIGANTIETVQFDPVLGIAQPNKIYFYPPSPEIQARAKHLYGNVYLDDHPTECASCHSSSWHPIWPSYDLWTGAYGTLDDSVNYPVGSHPTSDPVVDATLILQSQKYKEFSSETGARNQSPYSHLNFGGNKWNAPYGDEGNGVANEPNFRLGKYLGRIAGEIYSRNFSEVSSASDQALYLFVVSGCSFGSLSQTQQTEITNSLETRYQVFPFPNGVSLTDPSILDVSSSSPIPPYATPSGILSKLLWINGISPNQWALRAEFDDGINYAEDYQDGCGYNAALCTMRERLALGVGNSLGATRPAIDDWVVEAVMGPGFEPKSFVPTDSPFPYTYRGYADLNLLHGGCSELQKLL